MPQEKAKIHSLFAVPNTDISAPEHDFYNAPEVGDEPEVCPKCYGSGMEVVAGKGARKCECRKQKSSTNTLEKARIPKRYINCNFDNYIPNNDNQREVVWLARKLPHEYHPNYDGAGILFMGSCGVGKTHL